VSYYYTYVSGGSYELTSLFEAERHDAAVKDRGSLPGVLELGTHLGLTPLTRDLGLVGYWSFDEGSGLTAYDYSGKGNEGTLVNGPVWESSGCMSGECLQFDGVDDWVGVANNTTLTPAIITVGAWVKLTDSTLRRQLFNTKWFGWSCETDVNHKPFFRINNGGDSPKGEVLIVGDWYYFVGVYNPNATAEYRGNTLYINGQRVGTTPQSTAIIYSIDILTIGKYTGGLFWGGLVDDVRIYNRALSAKEIEVLYSATK
jgi:hypothetical protein